MKLKKLKRGLSALLAGLISINTLVLSVSANQVDQSYIFDFLIVNNLAYPMLVENYQDILDGVTEITMPESGTKDGLTYVCAGTGNDVLFGGYNDYLTKVIFPSLYSEASFGMFYGCSSIQEIIFESTSSDFTIRASAFQDCISLKNLYIYAESLKQDEVMDSLDAFANVPSTATAYVKNETVKASLETLSWPGTIVVDPTLGDDDTSVDKTVLNNTIIYIETYLSEIDKTKYNGITELETALTNAKEVYDNDSATQEEVNEAIGALGTAKNNVKISKTPLSEKIAEAEAFLNGIDNPDKYVGIENLRSRIINAKLALDNENLGLDYIESTLYYLTEAMNNVHLRTVDRTALETAINEASEYINSLSSSDYNNYWDFSMAISDARRIYNADSTQEEIDQAVIDLKAAQVAVTKRDASDLIEEMNEIIVQLEALDESEYTEESWLEVQSAIEYAKSIEDGFRSNYTYAIYELNNAKAGLVAKEKEPAGAPFIKVEKNAKEAVLDTYTADENTAGAVKIKITMDCAEDVNFNKYASIELKATASGTESYLKLTGTGEQNEATYGEQGIVLELPLTNAISVGDEVKLTAYTYAWNGAADYVYGITKVEYVNEVGQILKVITDRTIALDELKADIAKAEKIEQGDYTDESFAVLQAAIGTAKLVADDAEKAVIDEAREALAKAIAGLTTEPIIVTGTVTGTIKVSDEDAETEMTVTAVSADGTETSITATSMGTYALEDLALGDYTLTISGGKYAPRSYEITVTEGEIAQDVELNPYGDINGDGKVTTADVGMANSHAKGVSILEGYKFVCANVSGDEIISTADVGMINSHAKGVKALW